MAKKTGSSRTPKKKATKKKVASKEILPEKKDTFGFGRLDSHGERMLQVVCYALGLFFEEEDSASDYQRVITDDLIKHGSLSGTPEEWNEAAGFTNAYWSSGSNVHPHPKDYDFGDLVSNKYSSSYDEGWDVDVYDEQGLKREIMISATLLPAPTGEETFDMWLAVEPSRLEALAKKREEANQKIEAKKAEKLAALNAAKKKLTAAERKALGIR